MDMNQLVAMQQSVTFLGQIGGMALAQSKLAFLG